MIRKKLVTKTFLFMLVLGAILSAVIVSGCTGDAGHGDDQDSDRATVGQGVSERDSGGEHDEGREGKESREEGYEGGGEHGAGGDGGGESNEAAMSSPIIPLGESWNGVLGGLAVSMQYDSAIRSVHGTVRNTLSQSLCYVQAEPHIKSGTKTVGELGPEKLGDLNPGQEATTSLTVASEPKLAGASYDGYVVHMEIFDCGGPGPASHTGGEGPEGNGEHGSGVEEGGGANALAPDEPFDAVRSGARLNLKYDAPSNSFMGTVENTTNGVLGRMRVEVHLSNGAELGPTTPTDMAPGEVVTINLPATPASFTGWTAHAEVGAGGEGSESGGEHGSEGEQGGGESDGEHGSSGERRGGGLGQSVSTGRQCRNASGIINLGA